MRDLVTLGHFHAFKSDTDRMILEYCYIEEANLCARARGGEARKGAKEKDLSLPFN